MKINFQLDMEKLLSVYNALRDYRNAPCNDEDKQLDALTEIKRELNVDELTVYYELIQIAYLQGRQDGFETAYKETETWS